MKDYYKTLGINKTATEDDIKKAYRKLAHQYHPDKKGGDEARFKEVNEAYQVLSNKDKRAAYDRFGTAEPFGPGGHSWGPFGSAHGEPFGFNFGGEGVQFDFGGGGDLGDIFDAFFEGLGVKPRRKTYERGSDLEVAETITLEDAFHGAKKKLEFQGTVRCGACGGYGHDLKKGEKTCDACGGQGEVRETRKTFFGNFSQVKACSKCSGLGKIPNEICKVCKGEGRMAGARSVSFDILPGISDGQIIKIKGEGEVGFRGAESGDLYVRIKIKAHPVFAREGSNLFAEKELNLVDALSSDELSITGIDGRKITIAIPEEFNLREKLKIKSEGMPNLGSGPFGTAQGKRGDLFISFNVRKPKKLTAKAKNLLEELKGEL